MQRFALARAQYQNCTLFVVHYLTVLRCCIDMIMALLQSSILPTVMHSLRGNSAPRLLLKSRVLSYSLRRGQTWRTSGKLYSAGASFGGRSSKGNGETTQLSRSLFITSIGVPFFNKCTLKFDSLLRRVGWLTAVKLWFTCTPSGCVSLTMDDATPISFC